VTCARNGLLSPVCWTFRVATQGLSEDVSQQFATTGTTAMPQMFSIIPPRRYVTAHTAESPECVMPETLRDSSVSLRLRKRF
jgi:hypothetical protein